MSSAYNTDPPNYSDPSVADDISSLISTALAVQEGLFNAREGLKRVNAASAKELLPRLVETDERYLKLLNESRTSATELYSAIQNFMDVAIPISQDAANPVEERVAIIKDFADKIAISAKQDLQPYDRQVDALKETLNQLVKDLIGIEATLKNQANSNNDEQSPSSAVLQLNATENTNTEPYQRHLDNIVILKFLASVVSWFVAPKAKSKVPDTPKAPMKTTTLATVTVDEAVLKDISALVHLFSGLVGKLGHFGAVWEKLVSDSAELSSYLSDGNGDQDVFDHRVRAEVGVYEKIKQALDDYCLRTI